MRKLISKIFLICVIVIVVLLILLVLRSLNKAVPSYSFLGSRKPVACKKEDKGLEDKRYTYSFEADYNDLCSKAHAELTPAGFIVRSSVQILSGKESRERYYYLKDRFPRGPVWIYIYDNRQYVDLHDLYNNVPKSNYAFSEKDGWVMVEVAYGRGWQWPF